MTAELPFLPACAYCCEPVRPEDEVSDDAHELRGMPETPYHRKCLNFLRGMKR